MTIKLLFNLFVWFFIIFAIIEIRNATVIDKLRIKISSLENTVASLSQAQEKPAPEPVKAD